MNDIRSIVLPLIDATAESIAPFGELVTMPETAKRRDTAYYGNAVQLWSAEGFRSDEQTILSLARISPRTPSVTWMERHFKHTQTFIPLGGKPFVMVLAPPGDNGVPDVERVTAMRFDGSAGFMMHIGTWHEFPFAIVPDTDVVVVLRRETMNDLEQLADDEAVGADLEKRHMAKRLGVQFEFAA